MIPLGLLLVAALVFILARNELMDFFGDDQSSAAIGEGNPFDATNRGDDLEDDRARSDASTSEQRNPNALPTDRDAAPGDADASDSSDLDADQSSAANPGESDSSPAGTSESPDSTASTDAAATSADSGKQNASDAKSSSKFVVGKVIDGWRQGAFVERIPSRGLAASGDYLNDKREGTWTFRNELAKRTMQVEYHQGGIMLAEQREWYLRPDAIDLHAAEAQRTWETGRFEQQLPMHEAWSSSTLAALTSDAQHVALSLPTVQPRAWATWPQDRFERQRLAWEIPALYDESELAKAELLLASHQFQPDPYSPDLPSIISRPDEAQGGDHSLNTLVEQLLREHKPLHLTLCGGYGGSLEIIHKLRNAGSVRELSLVGFRFERGSDLSELASLPALIKLNLIACQIAPGSLSALEKCDWLLELRINGDATSQDSSGFGAEALMQLKQMPWLEVLSLEQLEYSQSELQSGEVRHSSFSQPVYDLDQLLAAIAAFPSLRSLRVRLPKGYESPSLQSKKKGENAAESQGTIAHASAFRALSSLAHLEELCLLGSMYDAEIALTIGQGDLEAIRELPALRSLILAQLKIDAAALDALIAMPRLVGLRMHDVICEDKTPLKPESDASSDTRESFQQLPLRSLHLKGKVPARILHLMQRGQLQALSALQLQGVGFSETSPIADSAQANRVSLPTPQLRALRIDVLSDNHQASSAAALDDWCEQTFTRFDALGRLEQLTSLQLNLTEHKKELAKYLGKLRELRVLMLPAYSGRGLDSIRLKHLVSLRIATEAEACDPDLFSAVGDSKVLALLDMKLPLDVSDLKELERVGGLHWLRFSGPVLGVTNLRAFDRCRAHYFEFALNLDPEVRDVVWSAGNAMPNLERCVIRLTETTGDLETGASDAIQADAVIDMLNKRSRLREVKLTSRHELLIRRSSIESLLENHAMKKLHLPQVATPGFLDAIEDAADKVECYVDGKRVLPSR